MKPSVYFIECAEAKAIKIGWAVNVFDRLSNLQCGCPYELKVIETFRGGGVELEKRIHAVLRCGIRGEWFAAEGARAFLAVARKIGIDAAIAAYETANEQLREERRRRVALAMEEAHKIVQPKGKRRLRAADALNALAVAGPEALNRVFGHMGFVIEPMPSAGGAA